jgi:hypothetical protein
VHLVHASRICCSCARVARRAPSPQRSPPYGRRDPSGAHRANRARRGSGGISYRADKGRRLRLSDIGNMPRWRANMSSAFTLSQSLIRVSLTLPPSLPGALSASPYDDVVYRCGSVTSCAQQINLNRPIGMYLDEVEDVRKRQLCEFEYDAVSGNPGAPRSRLCTGTHSAKGPAASSRTPPGTHRRPRRGPRLTGDPM